MHNHIVVCAIVFGFALGASYAKAEESTEPKNESAPAESSGPPTAEPESTAPLPEPIGFQDDSTQYHVLRRTGVFIEPNNAAPQEYFVDPGTTVESIAVTKDGKWAWVTTEDGKPAFIALVDLSADAPLPEEVSGIAQVIDTGTIKIGSQNLTLSGVDGLPGIFAKQLQALIDAKGKNLECHRMNEKYICDLPGGIDVGGAAILNGAARATSDASPDYHKKADAAKAAGRGIWAEK